MKALKRKKQGKTDYGQRLRLISSGKTRLVVRKTNKNILLQFTNYSPEGDLVVVSANTNELKDYGWNGAKRNSYCAYLVGLLAGFKAVKKDVKSAVLDLGLNKSIKGNILYAALKGVLDSGIIIPHSKEVLPKDERIKGMHTANYAKKLGDQKEKIFSGYLKNKINPEELPKVLEEVKKKIIEKWKQVTAGAKS